MKKTMDDSTVQIKKPKHQEHEVMPDIAKRIKRDVTRDSFFSSYYKYEIDSDRLLEASNGNEKLVKEVQDMINTRQDEEKFTNGGFWDIQVFYSRRENSLDKVVLWVHVVFDHGHGVTLIAGRVGSADHTHKEFIDKSFLYSMANMLKNG